jgi:hypothetical protein
VVNLTGARRRCRVALVVGEVGHASGSFSEVGGFSETCTRGWKAREAAWHQWSDKNRGEAQPGRLTGGRQWWGADK